MKTARQSGWDLVFNEAKEWHPPFVSVSNDSGSYGEFCAAVDGQSVQWYYKYNDFAFTELPASVMSLVEFWLGVISEEMHVDNYKRLYGG